MFPVPPRPVDRYINKGWRGLVKWFRGGGDGEREVERRRKTNIDIETRKAKRGKRRLHAEQKQQLTSPFPACAARCLAITSLSYSGSSSIPSRLSCAAANLASGASLANSIGVRESKCDGMPRGRERMLPAPPRPVESAYRRRDGVNFRGTTHDNEIGREVRGPG